MCPAATTDSFPVDRGDGGVEKRDHATGNRQDMQPR